MYITGEAPFVNGENVNFSYHPPLGLTPGHLYVLLLKLSYAFGKKPRPRDGFEVDQTNTYVNSWQGVNFQSLRMHR